MGPATNEPAPFNLTELDRQLLAQTDEEFEYHDWENLKDIIARNDLAAFKRKPSDLKRYIAWSTRIKAQYGNITNYICQHRLRWHEPEANGVITQNGTENKPKELPIIPYRNPTPFADRSDYKILRNDWPYGLAPGITHICVWVKPPIATKEADGDVTDESRALIEDFVRRTFVERLAEEKRLHHLGQSDDANGVANADAEDSSLEWAKKRVLWFKNWTALQSVRSMEHIHVLVRDVPETLITEWTGDAAPVQ